MMLNLIQKTFLTIALLALCTSSYAKLQPINVTGNPMVKVSAHANTNLKIKGDSVEVKSNGFSSGVVFENEWDLTGYNRLQFNVHNLDSVEYLQITFQMQEKKCHTSLNRRVISGTMTDNFYVAPGEIKSVEIYLPDEVINPDVDSCFFGMHTSPYTFSGHYAYKINPKHIRAIKVLARRHTDKIRYIVSDLTILPGEHPKSSRLMAINKKDFFPFIDKYGQFKHKDWPGKTHCDTDFKKAIKKEEKYISAHPGPDNRSRYGGWTKGPRLAATGHFRVEKLDGKWWLVDPEGYLFWSHGVVRVTPSCGITPLDKRRYYFEDLPKENSELGKFYFTHDALLKPYYTARDIDSTYDYSSANIYRKYGEGYLTKFAKMAHKRLKSWGLNTLANSSDKEICMMDLTPYIERIEIHSRPIEGTKGAWWHFMDPFDPSFEAVERQRLKERQKELEDPWCVGFFIDNEIKWGNPTDLAMATIKAPADQPAKVEIIRQLKTKYQNIDALNNKWNTNFLSWEDLRSNQEKVPDGAMEDLRDFNRQLIEGYFNTVRRVFKDIAPDKLYMGCRFAGSNEDVLQIAAKYCDVISYNFYYHDLNWYELPEGIDKPVMVGEFHFGALDRGLFHPSQVITANQKERADRYYAYVYSALRHPNMIGTHWHQFSDQAASGRFDGENFNVGFTDICDNPYYELVDKIREIGYNMYEIRYSK